MMRSNQLIYNTIGVVLIHQCACIKVNLTVLIGLRFLGTQKIYAQHLNLAIRGPGQ